MSLVGQLPRIHCSKSRFYRSLVRLAGGMTPFELISSNIPIRYISCKSGPGAQISGWSGVLLPESQSQNNCVTAKSSSLNSHQSQFI